MKASFRATSLALLAAMSMAACVNVRTQGASVVKSAPADNHVQIVIATSAGLRRDRHLSTFLPALVTRLPQDFKLNGVDATAQLLDFDTPVPPPTSVRTLVFTPLDAEGQSGPSWLDFAVTLNDATLGRIWVGRVRLSSGGWGSYDASAADRAAISLLEQLRDAKLIDIAASRLVTP
jgi:hypothetical protein